MIKREELSCFYCKKQSYATVEVDNVTRRFMRYAYISGGDFCKFLGIRKEFYCNRCINFLKELETSLTKRGKIGKKIVWRMTEGSNFFSSSDAENHEEILYLFHYHPFLYGRNPKYDFKSNLILNLKREGETAIEFFHCFIDSLGDYYHMAIAVVPPHDPESISSGIRILAEKLCHRWGRTDATSCLVRYKKIDKLSSGGSRDIEHHFNSIRVEGADLIRGKDVWLLDDVTTSGNSLLACKKLLEDVGASKVRCLALGKTG